MSVSYMPRQDSSDGGGGASWPSPPDPGDLSRRLARRRTELRLSAAQVAARARLNLRYLEYLERYPARPDGAVLRQLAAALQTSPAALLGAGSQVPPGHVRRGNQGKQPDQSARHPAAQAQGEAWDADGIRYRSPALRLNSAECRRLIEPGGIGRIAFCTPSGPVVLPVNYIMVSGAVVIRVGQGSLIEGHAYDKVAFEVDHIDEALSQGWSVLISGQAHNVLQPTELRRLRAEADLTPWPGGEHDVFIRIAPEKITGRRVESQ